MKKGELQEALNAMIDLSNSERYFATLEQQWFATCDATMVPRVGDILYKNPSLWHTQYGALYREMCRYHGLAVPPAPPRQRVIKYTLTIYNEYET